MTENNANKNTTKVVLISLVAALAIVSLLLVWMNLQQKTEMKEMVELMEFEKEQLEDEYEELAIQFDGYQHLISTTIRWWSSSRKRNSVCKTFWRSCVSPR